MDNHTKDYVDANLRAVKAENDKRFSEVMNGITLIGDRLDLQKGLLLETKQSAEDAKSASSSTKWNILATALAVIGILFTAWAIWAQGIEIVTGMFNASDANPPTIGSNDEPER